MQHSDPEASLRSVDHAAKLFTEGKTEEAIEYYTLAITQDPNSPTAYMTRGIAYLSQKRNQEALADFNTAIDIAPRSGLFHQIRGDTYMKLGDDESAIADYKKSASYDKTLTPALVFLALTHREHGQINKALIHLTNALNLKPKNRIYKSFMHELLRSINHDSPLNQIEKKVLYNAITTLGADQQIPLLEMCLDINSAFSQIIHNKTGFTTNASINKLLRNINERLKAISLDKEDIEDFVMMDNSSPNVSEHSLFKAEPIRKTDDQDDYELVEQIRHRK